MRPSRPSLAAACALVATLTWALMIAVMLGATFSWRVLGLRIRLNDVENALAVGALCSVATVVAGWRVRRMRLLGTALVAAQAVLALIVIARHTEPFIPVGSLALFESDTMLATLGRILVGPSVNPGWHQPGPLYVYLVALFYALSGYRTVALTIGAMTVNLAAIATIAWVAARERDARVAVLLTAMSVLFMAVFHAAADSPVFLRALVLPTVAFLVVSAAVSAGRVRLSPLMVICGSVVGQEDVRLLPVVVGVTLVVLLAQIGSAVREHDASARGQRWWTLDATLWVALALWMLPLADQLGGVSRNLGRLLSVRVPDGTAVWIGTPVAIVLAGWLALWWRVDARQTPVRLPAAVARVAYATLFGIAIAVGLFDFVIAVAHSGRPGDRERQAQMLAGEIRAHVEAQHVQKLLIRVEPGAADVAAGVVVALQRAGTSFAVEQRGDGARFDDALKPRGDETDSVTIAGRAGTIVANHGPAPRLWAR